MTKRFMEAERTPLELGYMLDCSTVGELKRFLENMQTLLDSYHPNTKVSRSSDRDWDYDFYVVKYRAETDEEYTYRVENERVAAEKAALKEAARTAKQKEKERAQFERLKKKLGA